MFAENFEEKIYSCGYSEAVDIQEKKGVSNVFEFEEITLPNSFITKLRQKVVGKVSYSTQKAN